MSVSARTIYVCPLCDWWEGDSDGEGAGRCNGRPEAPHALVEMERVAVVPATTQGAVAIDDAATERAVRALCADEAWEDDWMIAMNVVGVVIEALRGQ